MLPPAGSRTMLLPAGSRTMLLPGGAGTAHRTISLLATSPEFGTQGLSGYVRGRRVSKARCVNANDGETDDHHRCPAHDGSGEKAPGAGRAQHPRSTPFARAQASRSWAGRRRPVVRRSDRTLLACGIGSPWTDRMPDTLAPEIAPVPASEQHARCLWSRRMLTIADLRLGAKGRHAT